MVLTETARNSFQILMKLEFSQLVKYLRHTQQLIVVYDVNILIIVLTTQRDGFDKIKFSRLIFRKYSNVEFPKKNPSSGRRVVP